MWGKKRAIFCRQQDVFVFSDASNSPTATEALTHLRTLREQLKHLIDHLQLELHSQKETTEQLRKEMV